MQKQVCSVGEEMIRSIFLSNDISEHVIQELMSCNKAKESSAKKVATETPKSHSSVRAFREAMRKNRNPQSQENGGDDVGILIL